MTLWTRAWRRLVYGQPIVVVSGLPRSGTSMMMKMLEAGGLPVWQDGMRPPDDHNPDGYFELERVKQLDKPGDKRWVRDGRGRAVKVISMLLEHLPRTNNYKVIFMRRDLEEVLASQDTMLAARGQAGGHDAARLREQFETHLGQVGRLLTHDPAFAVLEVIYADVLEDPARTAERVQRFVGATLDRSRMIAAVDARLYRHRLRAR